MLGVYVTVPDVLLILTLPLEPSAKWYVMASLSLSSPISWKVTRTVDMALTVPVLFSSGTVFSANTNILNYHY